MPKAEQAIVASLLLLAAAPPAAAEVALFSQRNFQGASYALTKPSSSLSFSARSVRVLPGQPWELCPRPFFGGDCITVSTADPKLNLPRAFSGMVRSARPVAADRSAPTSESKPDPQP